MADSPMDILMKRNARAFFGESSPGTIAAVYISWPATQKSIRVITGPRVIVDARDGQSRGEREISIQRADVGSIKKGKDKIRIPSSLPGQDDEVYRVMSAIDSNQAMITLRCQDAD